jgi:uncharacterized protein YukE
MYISGMGITGLDTNKINEYLDRRTETVDKAIKSLSLGLDKTTSTFSMFSNYLMTFSAITSASETSFFKLQFDKLYQQMIQPIPEQDLAASGMGMLSHRKFALLSQSILAHPKCADFFYAAAKDGCKIANKELQAISKRFAELKNTYDAHLAEVQPYIDMLKTNPEKALSTVIAENQDAITAKSREMYLKLFELNAALNKDKNFAAAKAGSVETAANELNALIRGAQGMANMPVNLGNIASVMEGRASLWRAAEKAFDYADSIADLTNNIKSDLSYDNLFSNNIRNLLAQGRTIDKFCANLSTMIGSNPNALNEATRQISSMIPFIQGVMGSMGQKNMTQRLDDASPNKDMFDTLKANLGTLVKPTEEMERLRLDMQATVAMTNSLVQGILPPDNAVSTLSSRMANGFSVIDNYISQAAGIYTAFQPIIDSVAQVAYDALKKTAPTPLKSLALGDVKSYNSALINPNAITQWGQVMESMAQTMESTANMTIAQASIVNELMDYISREHVREIMTTYLADSDTQKAVAIAGLKRYVSTDIQPIANLLNIAETLL